MTASSGFELTWSPRRIIFREGAVEEVPAVARWLGRKRAVVLCSRSLASSPVLVRLCDQLDTQLAGLYDRVLPHVPREVVAEVVEFVRGLQADLLVAIGGGSVLDAAKAVSLEIEGDEGSAKTTAGPGSTQGVAGGFEGLAAPPQLPIVAIPTTYSGAEVTAGFGVTDRARGVKVGRGDRRVLPRVVLYDPRLTLDLPPLISGTTGMNALAHCVEALYARGRSPYSDALALEGIRRISQHLPRCVRDGRDLTARSGMLEGALLGGLALGLAGMGLHHGVCQVLGGRLGVPHGVANGIILPHAMRFNEEAAAEALAAVARAMGAGSSPSVPEAAADAAAAVEALAGQLAIPRRLRETGVPREILPELARLALENRSVQANPRPVRHAAELEALLEQAW